MSKTVLAHSKSSIKIWIESPLLSPLAVVMLGGLTMNMDHPLRFWLFSFLTSSPMTTPSPLVHLHSQSHRNPVIIYKHTLSPKPTQAFCPPICKLLSLQSVYSKIPTMPFDKTSLGSPLPCFHTSVLSFHFTPQLVRLSQAILSVTSLIIFHFLTAPLSLYWIWQSPNHRGTQLCFLCLWPQASHHCWRKSQ